jgi:hypothetical protein
MRTNQSTLRSEAVRLGLSNSSAVQLGVANAWYGVVQMEDATTAYVAQQLFDGFSATCPRPWRKECAKSAALAHEGGAPPLEPVLLLLNLPSFVGGAGAHTGHSRAWTLLHALKYRCWLSPLAFKLVVLVAEGELAGCNRICRATWDCTCHENKHARVFAHNNVAHFATGKHAILCDEIAVGIVARRG